MTFMLSVILFASSVPPENLSPTEQHAWDQLVCVGDPVCRDSGQYNFPYQGITSDPPPPSTLPPTSPNDRVRELLEPYIPSREELEDSQSFWHWLMPPAYASEAEAKARAYRAIDSIGSAAESAVDWFVPVAHIMLSTMLSYRLTFYLIHGPKNS